MNIDDLTIGQVREIREILELNIMPKPETTTEDDDFIGKYVICRCYSAGVHAGFFVSQNGDNVVLKDSKRLWSWTANGGIALSGVAQHGINKSKSKVDSTNPLIKLIGVIEIIPASTIAMESINGC